MKSAISGKTLRWTFDDGPVAGKTYEHTFGTDGTVTYRQVGGDERMAQGKPRQPTPVAYQAAQLSFDVFVVTYLSPESGYTLTTVLDFKTARLVAVASNHESVTVQHGTFEAIARKAA